MPTPPVPEAERRYRPLQRGAGLRLLHCRCQARRGDPALDEEHAAFSITLVDRGHFGYRTRAGSVRLAPGWLMLGNAGEGYACSHDDSDGTGDDCTVLSLSAPQLEDALQALGASAAVGRFTQAGLPPLPRVAALLQALDREGGEGFALEETALAVVAHVRRALDAGVAPVPLPRQDERARAAAHCIETRSAEALSVEEVARVAGLGSFQLLRVFRQSFGVTPHQYLMRQRLLHALRLLRDTALPVIDVAYEAGWADLSNFNRAFRREFGCPPSGVRRGDRRLLAPAA